MPALPPATLSVKVSSLCSLIPCVPRGLQRLKSRAVGSSHSPEAPPRGHSQLSAGSPRGPPRPTQSLRAGTRVLLLPSFTRDLARFTRDSPAPCLTPRPKLRGLHPAFPLARPPAPEATPFLGTALRRQAPQAGAAGAWLPAGGSRGCSRPHRAWPSPNP